MPTYCSLFLDGPLLLQTMFPIILQWCVPKPCHPLCILIVLCDCYCSWLLYCSLRVYSLVLWVAYSRIDVMSSTWHKGRVLWEREHKKEGVLRSKASSSKSSSGEFFENNNLVIISQSTWCTFYTTCIIIVWNIRVIPIIWTGAQAWGILNVNMNTLMNTLLSNILKWV